MSSREFLCNSPFLCRGLIISLGSEKILSHVEAGEKGNAVVFPEEKLKIIIMLLIIHLNQEDILFF